MPNLFCSCLVLAVLLTTASTAIASQVYSFRVADDYGYNLVEATVSLETWKWYPVCYMDYTPTILSLMCTKAGFGSRYFRSQSVTPNGSHLGIFVQEPYYFPYITYTFMNCSLFQKVFCISSDPNKYPVRLTGGDSPREGRLEMNINGVWGTVCGDLFSTIESAIVCRQLGFTKLPGSVYAGRPRSGDTSPIWLDDLDCYGYEPHLLACRHPKIGTNDCTHAEDVHVNCSAELMLVGGLDERRGRLEIKIGDTRGSVCDDFFNLIAANVVCRQLGFTEKPAKLLSMPIWSSPSKIWLDDVTCIGNESHLWDCKHRGWGVISCTHSEDVVMECPMADDYTLRLQGGSVSVTGAYGRLEVKLGGTFQPLCGEINQRGAELACRQMGYPSNTVLVLPRGHFSAGNPAYVLSDVTCERENRQFRECSFNVLTSGHMAFKVCGGTMGIMCTDQPKYQVRLVGGNHTNGRVEVGFGGIWGTVCLHGFDQRAAKVVCRQLGYSAQYAHVVKNNRYPAASVDTMILLDDVNCDGSENSLGSCELSTGGQPDCAHWMDVAISCLQSDTSDYSVRLVGGTSSRGKVEVIIDGQWGTVCDDLFDSNAAKVVCRQLGYSGNARVDNSYYSEITTIDILLDDVNCNGDESSLDDCVHNTPGTNDCSHTEDVAVECMGGMASPKAIAVAVLGSLAIVAIITAVACYCRSKSRNPPNRRAGRRQIRSLSQSLPNLVSFQYNNSSGTLQTVPSGRRMIPPTSPGIYGGPPSYYQLFPNGVAAVPSSNDVSSPPPYPGLPDPVVASVPSQPASPNVPIASTSLTWT